jgi:aryl-alcohol dehydrogenase-like predicted oxidoreductase
MIPGVTLARSGIRTSRLGFGTSRLHYLGRRDQQNLLAAAADLGIVHFDTAPAYGDGRAETALGRFVRGQRDRFVIATKYGIPGDPLIATLPWLATPMHGARAVASRLGAWQRRLPPLTAAGLRGSAEHSLRRLRIDALGILLLHEPSVARLPNLPAILEELGRLKQRGLTRAFGVAGAWSGIATLIATLPELVQVVQTAEAEWPAEHPPDITYGAIAVGTQGYFSAAIDAGVARDRMRAALARRPEGVVLVSTTKAQHLFALVEAVKNQTA